ncbi:SURF1 family protein [Ideonella sp. A 288]|uniref:SURF1 family protein n=1 Tax=Ideonella sp. A 288 TaxID=1962181 RepID=UPI000B4B962F|nr:SURF1 family protein [Ideonella sp. A 288]
MIRSRWAVAVVALLSAALTARLGLWQLDRAAQKVDLATQLEQRGAMPALAPAELPRNAAEVTGQLHRRVVVTGHWLHAHTVFLENRQMNGVPGFFVVTPLQLSPGDHVLVQRGWMPRDPTDRTRLQPLPRADGAVVVIGRMAPSPSKLYEFDTAASGPIRQNLDLTDFSREIGLPLRPFSVQQLDAPDAPDDGLRRQWLAPALGVGKHHGYAFQWFALCALIIGLYVWFQLLRPRNARTQ